MNCVPSIQICCPAHSGNPLQEIFPSGIAIPIHGVPNPIFFNFDMKLGLFSDFLIFPNVVICIVLRVGRNSEKQNSESAIRTPNYRLQLLAKVFGFLKVDFYKPTVFKLHPPILQDHYKCNSARLSFTQF